RDSDRPFEPSPDRMSLSPLKVRTSTMPSDYDHPTSSVDQSGTGRSVPAPDPQPTQASQPNPRGSDLPPGAAPLPPPPPPGWPPGTPPAWWFPPGTPGPPPLHPGVLVPPGWGHGVESPPAHSRTAVPWDVHRLQAFW